MDKKQLTGWLCICFSISGFLLLLYSFGIRAKDILESLAGLMIILGIIFVFTCGFYLLVEKDEKL